MSEERKLTIHFNNGTKMDVSFPTQIKNSAAAVLEGMKKMLEADKLVLEAEGRLVIIPWASVQHVEVSPVPPATPFGVIKGARVVQVDAAKRG
jgi:hypothetical protein